MGYSSRLQRADSKQHMQKRVTVKNKNRSMVRRVSKNLRVCYPSAGVQQGCRAHKCVSVPPIGRAGGATASAQDALVQAVEPLALLRGLAVLFAIGGRVARLEPWLHSSTCQSAHDILGSELGSMEFTLAQVKEGLQT